LVHRCTDVGEISQEDDGLVRDVKIGYVKPQSPKDFLDKNLNIESFSSVAVIISTGAYNREARGIVADVDGQIVDGSDLEKSAGKALSEQRERLYQLQKRKLKSMSTPCFSPEKPGRRGSQ
jgi:hypothetical protein